jgi:thiol-disulfide isomerase/thioredoxin
MSPEPFGRLVGLVLVVVALTACGTSSGGGGAGEGYVSGDGTVTQLPLPERPAAPEVSGETLDDTRLDVADLRGQVVVLNVWGSWCPPCRAEARALERVHQATKSQGVAFVGLNIRDQADAARAFQRNFGVTYPSIEDPSSKLLLGFRGTLPPSAIPSTLVLDRQGRVAVRILGQISELSLRQVIDEVATEATGTPSG